MLTCASTFAIPGIPASRGAEWTPCTPGLWSSPRPLADALRADVAPAELAIAAYANEGRWVVACPDCCSAQLAARDDHRFMCVGCGNVVVDGLWRPVIWPADPAAIEAELERRPIARTRNWLPGETAESLAAEFEAATAPAPAWPALPPAEPDPEGEVPT